MVKIVIRAAIIISTIPPSRVATMMSVFVCSVIVLLPASVTPGILLQGSSVVNVAVTYVVVVVVVVCVVADGEGVVVDGEGVVVVICVGGGVSVDVSACGMKVMFKCSAMS